MASQAHVLPWNPAPWAEVVPDTQLGPYPVAHLEEEWAATTSGTWHAHMADDAHFMTAFYVSTQAGPGPVQLGFIEDKDTSLAAGTKEQANHEQVVAITLLQEPRLADAEQAQENTTL